MPTRREVLNWGDVVALVDHLLPQFQGVFDSLLMITRGGIIPGGMIAQALSMDSVLTAAVMFPPELKDKRLAWPTFLQFPDDALVRDRRVLIVDDIWSSGRTITTVMGRLEAAGARYETAVLHYKPVSNLFKQAAPTYYGAVTDAIIVYPWEVGHGKEGVRLPQITPL